MAADDAISVRSFGSKIISGSVASLASPTIPPLVGTETNSNSNSNNTTPTTFILRISIPVIKAVKAIKVSSVDTTWTVKKMLMEKLNHEVKEAFNYGLYLPPKGGKLAKFLDESKPIMIYKMDLDEVKQ